jgi:predicted Zn-dependent peptidase
MGDWKMAETLPEKIQKATPQQILDAARKYINGIRWAYLGDVRQMEAARTAFEEQVN